MAATTGTSVVHTNETPYPKNKGEIRKLENRQGGLYTDIFDIYTH